MFYTIEELVQQADRDYQGNIAELMIATETELSGRDRSEILELMTRNLEVMKDSVQTGLSPEKSPTGLTGGDAAKLDAYIKKYKWQAFFGPFFKIAEAALELAVPLVMADIIDNGIPTGDASIVLQKGIMLVILSTVGYACSLTCQYFASVTSQGTGTEIRNALFAHIQALSHKEIDRIGTPSLMTRITSDINNVERAIAMTIRMASRAPFLVIGATILAIRLNLQLSIIFIIASIFIALSIYYIITRTMPAFKKVQKMLDRLSLITRENLEGVRVIRSVSSQDYEKKRFEDAAVKQRDLALKAGKLNALLNPITILIVNIAVILIIYQGGIKIDNGIMSQGEIIAFISYMTTILNALIAFSNTLVIINKGNASAKRINEVFDIKASVVENPKTMLNCKSDYRIEFDDVDFTYDSSKEAFLQSINLKIKPNQTIGIIGVTGAGKSTLIQMISRFYDVTKGSVKIDGVDVKDYAFNTLRKKVSVVPQQVSLFSGTLRKNMQWGKNDATDEEIYRALEIAQAKDFVDQLPKGLDTMIYQGGKNLSGGQRQRLSIARAMVGNPEILIMDDSASALDFATDAALRKAIYKNMKNTTVIIVSQRVNTVRNADLIVVLDEGQIVGKGTHLSLLKDCEIYEEICKSQLSSKELENAYTTIETTA